MATITTRNHRARWAAIGAAIAVSLGAGGIGLANAAKGTGERAVYTAIEPCRLVDTRPTQGIGGRTAPLGADDTIAIRVHGSSGQCTEIPNDATAVELNVTAVGASQLTHLTIWGPGPRPNASSLNPAPGQPPTPNAVTTNLADDGTFRVFNFRGNVHLIADLVGIYQHHHHDDRYYTRAQTDARIADIPAGPRGPSGPAGPPGAPTEAFGGPGVFFPGIILQPQWTFSDIAETITTESSGRLVISKTAAVGLTCQSSRIYYLLVDGEPVRSSAVSADTNIDRLLTGVTDGVVPAGEHVIGVGGQCLTGGSSGSSTSIASSSTILVVP